MILCFSQLTLCVIITLINSDLLNKLIIPLLVSILILGVIGFSQEAEAVQTTIDDDTVIDTNTTIGPGDTMFVVQTATLTINPGVTPVPVNSI